MPYYIKKGSDKMNKCSNCGAELKDGVRFCVECGYAVSQAEDQPEAVASPIEAAAEAIFAVEEAAETGIEPPVEAAPVSEPVKPAEPVSPAPSGYGFTAAPPAAPSMDRQSAPVDAPGKPPKKSRWEIMSGKGTLGAILLMNIPVVGLILMIAWSCGACRKYAKRNLARAMLILFCACLVLSVAAALVIRFAFPDTVVAVFEALCPGYTLSFN